MKELSFRTEHLKNWLFVIFPLSCGIKLSSIRGQVRGFYSDFEACCATNFTPDAAKVRSFNTPRQQRSRSSLRKENNLRQSSMWSIKVIC